MSGYNRHHRAEELLTAAQALEYAYYRSANLFARQCALVLRARATRLDAAANSDEVTIVLLLAAYGATTEDLAVRWHHVAEESTFPSRSRYERAAQECHRRGYLVTGRSWLWLSSRGLDYSRWLNNGDGDLVLAEVEKARRVLGTSSAV